MNGNMNGCAFRFAGQDFIARASGALYWPSQDMLIVADLHLGKSERMARRGGALLPPFESRETLQRLRAEMAAVSPSHLALLGDVYDDDAAAEALAPQDRADLDTIMAGCRCTLLSGNHDARSGAEESALAGIILRHIAGDGPDISGHYHPKATLAGRSRPCFLIGAQHVILPAFGHYTGGLRLDSPALTALVPEGRAILTGRAALAIPLSRAG